MLDELQMLSGGDFHVSDKITIKQPTIAQIREFGERDYYNLAFSFIERPYDRKVQLDDIGVDYEKVSDFEYFLMSCKSLAEIKTGILFEGIDFGKLEVFKNNENDELLLLDKESGVKIDRLIYYEIAKFIRTTHHIPTKTEYNPGNATAKKKIIEKERRKLKKQNGEWISVLAPMVSSIVWDTGSPTDFKNVWDLTLYQLKDGVLRKNQIKKYETSIIGAYAGVLNMKKVDLQDINWCGKIDIEPRDLTENNTTSSVIEKKK